MIFKSKDEKITLDTDTQTVTCGEKTHKFLSDHVRYHLHYKEENCPEVLQDLVNNGEIESYLDDFDQKVTDMIHSQADKWIEQDKEYKTAVDMGNLYKAEQIGNMYVEMAKEPIYNAVVYA